MDGKRKGNASGNRNSCGWWKQKQKDEEGRQLAKHLEALDTLASEDSIQSVEAGQLEIHFSKCFVDLIVDTG